MTRMMKVWARLRMVLRLLGTSWVETERLPNVPSTPPRRTWVEWLDRIPVLLDHLNEAAEAVGKCDFWEQGNLGVVHEGWQIPPGMFPSRRSRGR
jgi:hypothetical protein